MGALPPPPTRAQYEDGTVPMDYVGWLPEHEVPIVPALEADTEASVVVIGAGLAGSSVALHLAERGVDVVLLEAEQPGIGASGRNAGHVQPFLASMKPTEEWPDRGKRLLDLVIQNRDIVFDLDAKHAMDSDAVKTGMVEAATRKYGELESAANHWKNNGYDIEIIGKTELSEMLGSPSYSYGVHWREGGRVNPFLFTQGLATAATKQGARVYGNSPVIACERVGAKWRVRTDRGSVLTDKIVICTNGHAGNSFFPELAKTQFPLVSYALATKPLPADVLAAVNPSRVALTQYPATLYPMVIDRRGRIISASIPKPFGAHKAEKHFEYLLRYLNRTFPATRGANIEMESYWTGMTANSSSVYHSDYPKIYQVDDGVLALMNLGTWGVFLGPLLGQNLAQALADDRMSDLVLPVDTVEEMRFRKRFELKIRNVIVPAGRVVDRFNIL